MEKRIENIKFEYNGNTYEFGFGLEEVKKIANVSIKKKDGLSDNDFIKFALERYSDVMFISDKVAQEIKVGIFDNGFKISEDDELTFAEFFEYLVKLFLQTINDAAREVNPAIATINDDGSVDVLVDGESYTLKYTRAAIEHLVDAEVIDFSNPLEFYVVGSTIVRMALEHYKRHLSVKLSDNIFLSLWATTLEENGENDLIEVINALVYNMNEVVNSGAKKSKAAFQAITK